MDWYNENDSLELKQEKLFRKICKLLVEGKMTINDNITLEMAQRQLNYAIELEEYKAAQIFKNVIDKLEIV